jgi:Arc/MetJ family transcription regulator
MALRAFVPVRMTAVVEKIQEFAWNMHRKYHHMMLIMMLVTAGDACMRTTLNIDDDLLSEAQRMTGVTEKTALVREGLRALIERESARRLARLGGSDSQLQPISRRKS